MGSSERATAILLYEIGTTPFAHAAALREPNLKDYLAIARSGFSSAVTRLIVNWLKAPTPHHTPNCHGTRSLIECAMVM